MTRMVVTTFNIKFFFIYKNNKLCGTIETCFGIFYVFKSVKTKLMVLYVLMIILQFGQTIYQNNNGLFEDTYLQPIF
jgi:hypothetical protein